MCDLHGYMLLGENFWVSFDEETLNQLGGGGKRVGCRWVGRPDVVQQQKTVGERLGAGLCFAPGFWEVKPRTRG